jgi:lactate racemase
MLNLMDYPVTRVKLPYGKSDLEVDIPSGNLVCVLERQEIAGLKDESAAIRRALRLPTGSSPLCERLKNSDKLAILVTDNTRACPDDRLLPAILEEIETVVPRQNILIVVAVGLHDPLSREELIQKLGKAVVDNYRVINHDPKQTVNIGVTSRGTPVEINREVAGTDFILSTGFIEPHFFAGFSGGRKSIAPGVSSRAAIRRNHSFAMVGHEKARAGVLRGNPVHEDLLEQARLAGLDFIVNVLLNRKGQITRVVAGDAVLAHEKGCRMEKKFASASIDREVDITLTSNSGAPMDLDLYQTCKALDAADKITRPGGIIIVASLCNKGVGPQSFFELHSTCRSPQEVIRRIQSTQTDGVGWQNQVLARVQQKHEIFLFSSLPDEVVEAMHMRPIASLEIGVVRALAACGKGARIAVIPDGPRLLPVVAESRND